MSAKSASSGFTFPTKPSIPPSYEGLDDAATFARLASRPDRIHPEAVEFFESWLSNSNIAIKRRDGRLVFRPEFTPIGTARFFADDSAPEATSSSSPPSSTTKK
jgi:hypothetical protein